MHKEKLSASQAEMILHRLEVPDAIHDALAIPALAGNGTDFQPSRDDVWSAAEALETRAKTGWIWAANDLERLVLIDAITGSVWWAACKEDLDFSPRPGLAIGRLERTVEATTRIVSRVVGEELEPVLW